MLTERPGAKIKRAREGKRMTQPQLAELSGVTVQTLCKIENRDGGSVTAWLAVMGVLGLEFFPPVEPSRAHVGSLQSVMIRKCASLHTTPLDFTASVLKAYGRKRFTVDVASPNPPCQPCERFFDGLTPETDGLLQPWPQHAPLSPLIRRAGFVRPSLVWGNIPYDNIGAWIDKALAEHEARRHIINLLIPVRTSKPARAFRDAGAVRFWFDKRLAFGTAGAGGAKDDSMLYVLGATDAQLDALGRELPAHERLNRFSR